MRRPSALSMSTFCTLMFFSAISVWAETIPSKYLCGSSVHLQQAVTSARSENRAPRLLLMSGGGSHGAWGAGFINGWRDGGTRLGLDVITGVSAGSIAATFVFLEDARGLEDIFTKTTNKDFYRKRFILEALFSNSLYSTSRQKRTLDDVFNDNVLREVRDKAKDMHAPLLCVGTVNLASGEFVEWNLNEIALDKDYDLYRRILRASTAIPVVFPPVDLYGDLHSDGGTRQNVFATLERLMLLHAYSIDPKPFSKLGVLSLAALHNVDERAIPDLLELAEKVVSDDQRATAHIVINGKLDIDPATVKNMVLPIAKRGLSILVNERLRGNLYQLHYYLYNSETGDSIPHGWQFRFTRIPSGQHLPCAMIDFQPHCLRALYDRAYALKGGWETEFPKMD